MPSTDYLTPRARAKARARMLRAEAASSGQPISQGQALERVAKELGYRDWNTASARLSNAPELELHIGDIVSGRYLKQPFVGRVVALRELHGGAGYQVELQFDEPVNVVEFDSFSNNRQRVQAMVNEAGVSWTRTSDGEPHLVVWPGTV